MSSTIQLRVKAFVSETYDAKTIFLEPLDGEKMVYESGQFLTLIVRHNDHEVRRSYSFSSWPGENNLSITVKRVTNGEISRYLLDHLKVGDVLEALPPAGRFTVTTQSDTKRDIFMFAAGSGITPMYSLLKKVLQLEPQTVITLLYSNTRERTIIFKDALEGLQAQFPSQLRLYHLLSEPSSEWEGMRGRLNNTLTEDWVKNKLLFEPKDALFFVCGPPIYMQVVQFTLGYMGFDETQIRKENFTIPTAIPQLPTSEAHTIGLRYLGKDYQLLVPAYTNILKAALEAGIHLPYSCRGGRCSACIGKCISGKVGMIINDVLTERDLAQGWMLTCTGYPQDEEVVIQIL